MAAAPFELRSLPDQKKTDRWFLIQLPLRTKNRDAVDVPTTIGHVEGGVIDSLAPVLDRLIDLGASTGEGSAVTNPGDLRGKDRTISITEDQAIRLGLVFNIVSGRFSSDKVEALIQVVKGLPLDEIVFWLGRVSSGGETAETYRKMFLGLVP